MYNISIHQLIHKQTHKQINNIYLLNNKLLIKMLDTYNNLIHYKVKTIMEILVQSIIQNQMINNHKRLVKHNKMNKMNKIKIVKINLHKSHN